MNAHQNIYEQFANDAAFLWVLRSIAVKQSNYFLTDLNALEKRIDDHLDGLMTGADASWKVCIDAMSIKQMGEAFIAAVIAFRSLDVDKIQQVIELSMEDNECFSGVASALGWLPGRLCHSWIKKFLTSKDLNHKYLAITACSLRREDPREYLTTILQRQDCLAHNKLYARSLRLIGELKRRDLAGALSVAMQSDKPEVLFWANWSAVMLGEKSKVHNLQSYVVIAGEYQQSAIELAFRVLAVDDARSWIKQLAQDAEQIRNVIKATAALGDPQAINWLIMQMRIPALSRLAGEAFTTITGIDLFEHNLALDELPDLDSYLPNHESDSHVEMNEDEYLPFPNVDKVAAIWQKYQQRFTYSQRYFMGKPIIHEHLMDVYLSGNQRMRRMAALEIALLDSSHFLMNSSAKCDVVDQSNEPSLSISGIASTPFLISMQNKTEQQIGEWFEKVGVAVISTGMVCALGNHSALVCAAVKTGLSGYNASNILNRRNKEIVMAQVPSEMLIPLPDEFAGLNQKKPGHTFMVRLAATALLDCLSEPARNYPMPIFIACPELLPKKRARVEASFIQDLKLLTKCNIDLANSRCIHEGRAGGITALEIAYKYFRSTGKDFALIGGVDSYRYFDNQLEFLDKAQRLLAEGASDGFAPGEGASFVLVASPQACKKYSLAPRLFLGQPGCGMEDGHRYSEKPYRGDGLSRAFTQALSVAIPNLPIASIYSSLNGESFGAKELGVAQIRNHQYLKDVTINHPADCFGDIGAAMAPMMFGLIANNEKKPSLVYCSADGPQRGAVCVWQPEYV